MRSEIGHRGVLLVDDHQLFRDGLEQLLKAQDDLYVVGKAATAQAAVDLARPLQPDVILLDVDLPDAPCSVTLRTLHRTSPESRILILTMHKDPILQRSLLEAGANGYLTKDAPLRELLSAVRGGSSIDQTAAPLSLLTAREEEVLRLVAIAASNATIASELGIAEGTVKRHLNSILEKLEVTNRMAAVLKARRLGVAL